MGITKFFMRFLCWKTEDEELIEIPDHYYYYEYPNTIPDNEGRQKFVNRPYYDSDEKAQYCADHHHINITAQHEWPREENYSSSTDVDLDDDQIIDHLNFTYTRSDTSSDDRTPVITEESTGGEDDEGRDHKLVKWIKHYSSRQRILLVGEGDFSFSACLAVAFVQASNMVATSLDSQEFLMENYKKAPSNIEKLRSRGSKVIHGIDATKIANNALLCHLTFDRIIYNFPFAGFFKDLSCESQLRRHRRLVSLFLKNAKEMISEDGEIHISHKTNGWHSEWNLEAIAFSHRLRLIEAVPFHLRDYPSYRTKYGFGGDNNFNCNPSKTYKFGLKAVGY